MKDNWGLPKQITFHSDQKCHGNPCYWKPQMYYVNVCKCLCKPMRQLLWNESVDDSIYPSKTFITNVPQFQILACIHCLLNLSCCENSEHTDRWTSEPSLEGIMLKKKGNSLLNVYKVCLSWMEYINPIMKQESLLNMTVQII